MSNYLKKLAYVHEAMKKLAYIGPNMGNTEVMKVSMPNIPITPPPNPPAKVVPNSTAVPTDGRTVKSLNSASNAYNYHNDPQGAWDRIEDYQNRIVDGIMRREGIPYWEAKKRLEDKGRWYKSDDFVNGKYNNNKRFNEIASGARGLKDITWKKNSQGKRINPFGYKSKVHDNYYTNMSTWGKPMPLELENMPEDISLPAANSGVTRLQPPQAYIDPSMPIPGFSAANSFADTNLNEIPGMYSNYTTYPVNPPDENNPALGYDSSYTMH